MVLTVSVSTLGLGEPRKGLAEEVEGLGGSRREPLAGLGEDDLARAAEEERRAEPLLEQLDLVAHRRLGHPELFGGAGKAQAAGDGFEDADGGERAAAAWVMGISSTYAY